MGPTNLALVKLFQADQALREVQSRLEATTRNLRVQERRLIDVNERLALAHSKLKEMQSAAGGRELDIKSRDAHIEKLREQQSTTHNAKEYQTFLVEIATQKKDKATAEEDLLKGMESVEKMQAEVKALHDESVAETQKRDRLKAEIGDKSVVLQAEIQAMKAPRNEAAAAVPARAREMFDKLADRYEGEAMSRLERPDRRKEEYLCAACNMTLVADVYNKLHSRDEMVYCTSCRRILYIPDDLPVEAAVNKKKPQKKREGVGPQIGAYINRQSSAEDVLRSLRPEEPESLEAAESGQSNESGEASSNASEGQTGQEAVAPENGSPASGPEKTQD